MGSRLRLFKFKTYHADDLAVRGWEDNRGGSSIFDSPRKMKTLDGSILFVQAWRIEGSRITPYVIIPGFVVSSPRVKRDGKTTVIKVRSFTVTEQKQYASQLQKRVRGPLTFW